MPEGNAPRISRYVLCEDGFGNRMEEGKTCGFELRIRIPYYRGLPLSMIDDVYVVADGIRYSGKDILFKVHGGTFNLDEMKTVIRHRWNYDEQAIVKVEKEGGLRPGKHRIEAYVKLRINYLPFSYIGGYADLAIN